MTNSLPMWPHIYLYPLLTALILWAGLTALVALLNRRDPRPGRVALLVTLPLLLLAHHELWATRSDASIQAAYRAFLAGSLIWAWHELAFYSGTLTGPWRQACPADAHGLRRFGYALRTHLFHEIAIVGELLLLLWILRDGHNMLGLLVFLLSWAMQQSAKLNVFFGVPSLNIDLFPQHLRYLGSYWRRRAVSGFFIPSVSVITLLATMLWTAAHAHRFDPIGVHLALLATLVSLGALEHWLLALSRRPGHALSATQPIEESLG